MTDRPPSLVDRIAATRWRGPAWPPDYRPALGVLAALPGTAALLAMALASSEARQEAALRDAGARRIAAIATAQRIVQHRRAIAPYLAAPTLSHELAGIGTLLPADAVLRAITRGADGVLRIEVDCPDPDALLRPFRSHGWRSTAQRVVDGGGMRVTLEAGR